MHVFCLCIKIVYINNNEYLLHSECMNTKLYYEDIKSNTHTQIFYNVFLIGMEI